MNCGQQALQQKQAEFRTQDVKTGRHMSEPLQLIGRVFVDQRQLTKFRARTIGPASRYTDWGEWLATKGWYGDFSYEEIVAKSEHGKAFDEWFSRFFDDDQHGNWYAPVLDEYDQQSGCWRFMVFGFAENYLDFVTAVNALRQIDSALDGPGGGQFAIVAYAYGRGFDDAGSTEVVASIENGRSTLALPVDPEFRSWATRTLEAAHSSVVEYE